MEYVLRFLTGGFIVSAFAVVANVLRPTGFAGLFSAAPSVALATLTLTISSDGRTYAATEARSMIVGAGFVVAVVTGLIAGRFGRGHWLSACLPGWRCPPSCGACASFMFT